MSENRIKRLMIALIAVGLVLIGIGVSLIIFTEIATRNGPSGVLMIAGIIALGLFISVPAKLYLTLQLMKYNDDNLRARQENQSGRTPSS